VRVVFVVVLIAGQTVGVCPTVSPAGAAFRAPEVLVDVRAQGVCTRLVLGDVSGSAEVACDFDEHIEAVDTKRVCDGVMLGELIAIAHAGWPIDQNVASVDEAVGGIDWKLHTQTAGVAATMCQIQMSARCVAG
jgi:hypothetical protein